MPATKALERRKRKGERQARLLKMIDENPFITDDELAERLAVSVQTIRLDRLNLAIPEVRQRTRDIAQTTQGKLRSLNEQDVIGELAKLELGHSGTSVLLATPEMTFAGGNIVRGHYIFAQANSLAVALVDAEKALTGAARVRYIRPVTVGQRMVARALVTYRSETGRYRVRVNTDVSGEEVFRGEFVIVAR